MDNLIARPRPGHGMMQKNAGWRRSGETWVLARMHTPMVACSAVKRFSADPERPDVSSFARAGLRELDSNLKWPCALSVVYGMVWLKGLGSGMLWPCLRECGW
jgi:hypothetical protein